MADQREILEELNRASRNLGSANAQFGASAAEAAGSANSAIASLQELGSGAIQFSRAMTNGQEGMAKYGAAIGSAADGIGGLAQLAGGPVAFVIGGLIKIVGAVVGAVLENNDTIIKGYDKIADMGGATSFTTSSLAEAAKAFPVINGSFTKFIDTMSKMGGDLMGLGATAGEGMEKFIKIATVGEDVRHEFNRLGISQEKLTQVQAQYVSTQLKIGGLQNKDVGELRDASLVYATNLVELSAITGQSVDQLAKNREEDMKDVAYNIRLREIGATADGAAMAERMNKGVELAAQFGPEQRKAVRDVMASGKLITPEAIGLSQQFAQAGLSLTQSTEDLRNNRISLDQFNMQMRDAEKATREKMGKAMAAGGTGVSESFLYSANTLQGASKEMREGTAEQVKREVEAAKHRKDTAKTGQDAVNDATRALGEAFDKFISLISGAVNKGFQALMYAFKALTTGIIKFLIKHSTIFELVGDKLDVSLPYMFDSVEDLVKQQKDSITGLAEIERKRAKLGIKPGDEWSIGAMGSAARTLRDEEKDLKEQQTGITSALKQMLGTEDVDKVLKEKEAQATVERSKQEDKDREAKAQAEKAAKPATATAAPTAGPGTPIAEPKTISIGAGTVAPTEKFANGGIAKNPRSSIGASPTGGPVSIPLPGGRSIATTLEMPADLTSQRDSLLTQTDSINSLLTGYTSNLTAAVGNTPTTAPAPTRSFNNDMMVALANQLDEMLSKMKDNTSLQSELLALSKR